MKKFCICIRLAAILLAGSMASAELPKVKPGEPLPANLFVELAKVVNPAVVNIFTTYLPDAPQMGNNPSDPFFDIFNQFMGQVPQQSLGSGFLIREDGLIITNNHVVDKATLIKVQIEEKNQETFDAKLIGKDPYTDVALIKIDTKRKLPFVKIGTSQDVQVGEWVAAFGNPYGYGHTMTKGIISAIGREIDELNLFPFMQTDASINPGNSGGPLVNMKGEVIGVNTAIDARAQGIGFVIPIDNVKSILPQLEKDGTVPRGWIGVAMMDIDEPGALRLGMQGTEGALITDISPGGPADKAGMLPYDLVVEFAGHKVDSTAELMKAVKVTAIGKQVAVKVVRRRKAKTLAITVGNPAVTAKAAPRPSKAAGVKGPGFILSDFSPAVAESLGLPKSAPAQPVVMDVDPHSDAARGGLAPGDIILDVNRTSVKRARDVVAKLTHGTNILRVRKMNRIVLIPLNIP